MKHKARFQVKLTCQGELMEAHYYEHLFPALLKYVHIVLKHQRFGTMRFDLIGW